MAPRSLESLGLGQGTSNVARILVHIAHDPARRHIRTAFWFEHAGTAVRQRRLVAERVVGADMTSGSEHFVGWADINVPFWVESEVFSREGPILALLFVDDRDVRRDLLLIYNPVNRICRAISRIGRQPLGLQSQPLLRPIE